MDAREQILKLERDLDEMQTEATGNQARTDALQCDASASKDSLATAKASIAALETRASSAGDRARQSQAVAEQLNLELADLREQLSEAGARADSTISKYKNTRNRLETDHTDAM